MNLFILVASLPKTLYVNFKCLPIKTAFHLPIVVHHSVNIDGKLRKGAIKVDIRCFANIIIGFEKGSWWKGKNSTSYLSIKEGACLSFGANVKICRGFGIDLHNNSSLRIGSSSYINTNVNFECFNEICIGNRNYIAYNVYFQDDSAHKIISNSTNQHSSIRLGDCCWVCSNVHFYKSTSIGTCSVVASFSKVGGIVSPDHCLLSGNPCKIIKENIEWKV